MKIYLTPHSRMPIFAQPSNLSGHFRLQQIDQILYHGTSSRTTIPYMLERSFNALTLPEIPEH